MSEAVEYDKMKVPDLKRLLKERGLSGVGNKSELIARLQEHDTSADSEEVVADEDELLEGEDEEAVEDDEDEEEATEEKADETDEPKPSEESAKPKKIKLGETAEPSSTTESKPAAIDMLSKRAERFGIQSADAKKLARAQRFGLPVNTSSAANGKTSTGGIKLGGGAAPTVEQLEKMKKRAERFGTVVSAPLTKMAENEKMLKRKERFGVLTSGGSSISTSSDPEVEEKKRRRLERFGMAK